MDCLNFISYNGWCMQGNSMAPFLFLYMDAIVRTAIPNDSNEFILPGA